MPSTRTLIAALALSVASLASQAAPAAADAHPAATGVASSPRIDARQARQQHRIAEGRASGALTRHETRHLAHQQRAIRHAERHAMADGKLSSTEKARIERMQDHASRSIRRQKHDAQTRPVPQG